MGAEEKGVLDLFTKPLIDLISQKNFSELTEPQIRAIPGIIKGENILLIAPTGSGKTEAAMLPILDMIVRKRTSSSSSGIKVLYVTPLRALNRDLLDRLEWWCKKLDIKLGVRHGDTPQNERDAQSMAPPDILITTPETLQAILPARILGRHLNTVEWVIVDEVHELAGEKRGTQMFLGLERLRWQKQGDFQVIGLSATIGTPEKVAQNLVGNKRKCKVLDVSFNRKMELEVFYPHTTPKDYELAKKLYTFPEVAARLSKIQELVENHKSTLVFTNTRSVSEVLGSRFKVWDIDFPVGVHHGSLSRPTRVEAERGIKQGKLKGVVCTSSLELGIDIGKLDFVIQYNSPRQVTRLIQRVGRSGHSLGRTAKGSIIVQDSDDALEATVIAKRAIVKKLEPVLIPEKPFDVLAHQLAGMLLVMRSWSFEEALSLIRKASAYDNFSEEDLLGLLDYMYTRYPRLLWYSREERLISRPKRIDSLYKFYFENLSMIPVEKQYLVVEEQNGKPVGVLDEAFVAEYGEPGNKFVEGGSIWKILYIYKDRIYVKKEEDPLGAVPSWVGDEIPVPFEVAQEVGKIRKWVEKGIKDGRQKKELVKEFSSRYPVSPFEGEQMLKEIFEQINQDLPVPTDSKITIERSGDWIIIHCCLGLKGNRTLARILGSEIANRFGEFIQIQQDPYRILLRTDAEPETIKTLIMELAGLPDARLWNIGINAARESRLFKRRFLHVLRRFGAVSKDANITSMNLNQLIQSYEGTVVEKEGLKEVGTIDLDLDLTIDQLKKIFTGDVSIEVLERNSPIGRVGMEEIRRKTDLIPPQKMEQVILRYARARLLNESLTLLCTNCWKWAESFKVKDIHSLKCPNCDSNKIGAVKEELERVKSALRKKSRSGGLYDEARATANLIPKYGNVALVALAGRGLNAKKAKEVLEKEWEENDKLIAEVVERERENLKASFFS
jgi:ATP-dependent Lhr-like helicase